MIDDVAHRVHSTSANARVRALLVEAAAVRGTVIVGHALWVGAEGRFVDDTADSVGVAWRRDARIRRRLRDRPALGERIADRFAWTRTDRVVVDRLAHGSVPAHVWARVDASVVYARLGSRAVGADHALRMTPTAGRVAKVARNAFAHGRLANCSADRVHATRRRIAWTLRSERSLVTLHDDDALAESISGGSGRTRANRNVIRNCANGFSSANSDARVLASVSNASLAHWAIRVSCALRSTSLVRVAAIVADTFTNGVVVLDTASCVVSAWRREAWVFLLGFAWNG